MTIDAAFISSFKTMVPAAFTEAAPFDPEAIFIDGQIKLMCPQYEGVVTWEEYTDRQFTYALNQLFSMPATQCVILAFDDYAHVPVSKSMTQTHRRKHIPPMQIHERDALPPVVPTGELWMQMLANRTFKGKLIQLVIQLVLRRVYMKPNQSLIIDYQGHPQRYAMRGALVEELTGFAPMGEADIKFVRYTALYPLLQVNSVDGDSVPIGLLHFEKGFKGKISIYRMQATVGLSGKRKLEETEKTRRMYEFVDIGRLYYVLRKRLSTPPLLPKHPGHEIRMLVAMIGLGGTDFTRGLPQLSGKTLFEYLPLVWTKLASAYDPETDGLRTDRALDQVVCSLYRLKFGRHVAHCISLGGLLSELAKSSLSERTKKSLGMGVETFHCTLCNINWLLRYWLDQAFPDPIDPAYGYARTGTGAVTFAA